MSQLFASGGQIIGASTSASVLPTDIQGWFPFRIDCFGLLAIWGSFKSLLQHHSLKTSIPQCSVFFMIQLSYPYMTTAKTIALIIQTFVGKVMFLLFDMLSKFVIAFLPRSKCLLISWLQSQCAMILEPKKIKVILRHTQVWEPSPRIFFSHLLDQNCGMSLWKGGKKAKKRANHVNVSLPLTSHWLATGHVATQLWGTLGYVVSNWAVCV